MTLFSWVYVGSSASLSKPFVAYKDDLPSEAILRRGDDDKLTVFIRVRLPLIELLQCVKARSIYTIAKISAVCFCIHVLALILACSDT